MREEQEIARVINQYMNQLLRIAGSYLKNAQDAEDVVQDVLVRYMQRPGRFENEEHERAWLIRVTIHRSIDYWRAIKKRREREAELACEEIVKEDSVLAEILNLPKKYKAPMYLHYVEGYTIREIAAILKKPEGTISTCLVRGRKMLRKQWEEEYGYDMGR